mgnify:CR=1 FL=1
MNDKIAHALYFHIPFCVHRCAYCDFNTYAGQNALIPAYVDAFCREIELIGQAVSEKVVAKTIFFGGGTPSLLSAAQFASIFKSIRQNFDLRPDAEISLVANPGTLTQKYLCDLYAVGFNRLSLGVQSVHPDELRMLERIHSYGDIVAAALAARKAGFDNLSFDLIFGLPEQTLDRWQATVKLILGLHPEHLSLYALTLEHGTPFGRWAERGLLPLPDPDLAAEMYEWASEYLDAQGYEQYEISNWTKPNRKCEHNLQYWRNLPYLGFGAGAHGYTAETRYSNVLRIQTYIDRLMKSQPSATFPLSPAVVTKEHVSPHQAMQEHLMMGLRLTDEGISTADFRARFWVELTDVFQEVIAELVGFELLEFVDGHLRLTPRARLLGNQVFVHFVGE